MNDLLRWRDQAEVTRRLGHGTRAWAELRVGSVVLRHRWPAARRSARLFGAWAAEAVTLSAQEWTVGVASVARLCGVFLLLGFGLGLWACYRLTSFWHAIAGPRVAVSVENQTTLSVHPAHGAPKATRARRGRGGVLELPPAGP